MQFFEEFADFCQQRWQAAFMRLCYRNRRIPRHERAPSQWAGRWDALKTIEIDVTSPVPITDINATSTSFNCLADEQDLYSIEDK